MMSIKYILSFNLAIGYGEKRGSLSASAPPFMLRNKSVELLVMVSSHIAGKKNHYSVPEEIGLK